MWWKTLGAWWPDGVDNTGAWWPDRDCVTINSKTMIQGYSGGFGNIFTNKHIFSRYIFLFLTSLAFGDS